MNRLEILERMMSSAKEKPLDVNLEISNFCAASCVFCPNSKEKRPKRSMSMELFKKIVDEYAELGGGCLGLSSMQSDLFSDKFLLERLRYLEKYEGLFFIHTTTYMVGASKLSDEELTYFLKKMNYLQISVGGVDKDQYRKMYGVNAFDIVRQQLLRIKKIVDENSFKIGLGLHFRLFDASDVRESELVQELGNTFRIDEIRTKFFSWGGIINQADLPAGARLQTMDNSQKRLDCVAPWFSLSANFDGTVVGCGCVDWNARHPVGNLGINSIRDIWHSKRSLQFRQGFSSGNVPELCKDCSLYYPVDEAFSAPHFAEYKSVDGLWYVIDHYMR